MVGEEILLEIDSTLDRLICNAQAIENVSMQDLSETEIEAFQKTQESLLQHLLRMDQLLESKTKNVRSLDKKSSSLQIQEKRSRFENLKRRYHRDIYHSLHRKSEMLSKRRCKRLLTLI